MANISIQLPAIEAEHSIEIEIKINGNTQKYHYRVEIVPWQECPNPDDKIQCLRTAISKQEPQWKLVQIGNATEQSVPLMFREVMNPGN